MVKKAKSIKPRVGKVDSNTNLSFLKRQVIEFRDERNWKQFHDPKNLSMALAIERAELQETFLWKTREEVSKFVKTDNGRKKIQEELADILVFLLYLSEYKRINPKTDMSVLCPNCHAMIHRNKSHTLTIRELKEIIHGASKQ
jgi:dCTP diphosphatase